MEFGLFILKMKSIDRYHFHGANFMTAFCRQLPDTILINTEFKLLNLSNGDAYSVFYTIFCRLGEKKKSPQQSGGAFLPAHT